MSLKGNLSWGKYRKVQDLFCSNRRREEEVTKIGKNGNVVMKVLSLCLKNQHLLIVEAL